MIRAYADNVVIELEPEPSMTKGGLHIPQNLDKRKRGARFARVVAAGPGHYGRPTRNCPGGAFIPTTVKPGDRVVVDANAGQDYSLDLNVPRHNKPLELGELDGGKGEFRIVRESGEIFGVVDESVQTVEIARPGA